MASSSKYYRKLSGKWFYLFTKPSLWQGPDHLLWVKTVFMQEYYKRFYYKDIQALILRRNGRQHIWTMLWTALLVLFGSLYWFNFPDNYVLAFFPLLWFVCLVVNLVRGPCCNVYLQTAVQTEKFTHLVRERKAHKVLNKIKTLVENVQKPLVFDNANEPAAADIEGFAAPKINREDAFTAKPARPETNLREYKPGLHYVLFSVLLLSGILGGAQWHFRTVILTGAKMMTLVMLLVLVIMAVARFRRQIRGTLLSIVTWLTMIWVGLLAIMQYIFFIAATISHPEMANYYAELIKVFFQMQLNEHPAISAANIAFAVTAIVLGAVGFVAIVTKENQVVGLNVAQGTGL